MLSCCKKPKRPQGAILPTWEQNRLRVFKVCDERHSEVPLDRQGIISPVTNISQHCRTQWLLREWPAAFDLEVHIKSHSPAGALK